MAMDQLRIDVGGVKIGATPNCSEGGLKFGRASKSGGVEFEAGNSQIATLETLITEAADIDLHHPREFA
jgi:hypothetical protein